MIPTAPAISSPPLWLYLGHAGLSGPLSNGKVNARVPGGRRHCDAVEWAARYRGPMAE